MCIYCGGDATEVDHIIPYSYSQNNDEKNLVPACRVCNAIAYNQIFDSLAQKIQYVLRRRGQKKLDPIISGIEIDINKDDGIVELPEALRFNNIRAVKSYFSDLRINFSYEKIARAYNINRGIIWKIINTIYEPKTYKIRKSLGLPYRVPVEVIDGNVEDGSISLGSRICKCGQPFIPNHGLRKNCFICVPVRRRRK